MLPLFVMLKVNSQFIPSFVVCHGSELFTHMAKTNIHVDSSTKSGKYVQYNKMNFTVKPLHTATLGKEECGHCKGVVTMGR